LISLRIRENIGGKSKRFHERKRVSIFQFKKN
jgi:hypothetical protein